MTKLRFKCLDQGFLTSNENPNTKGQHALRPVDLWASGSELVSQNDFSSDSIIMHSSVKKITQEYFSSIGEKSRTLDAWHFCDNEKDANHCAELTLKGIKKATSSSLWWYEKTGEPLPKKGELNVITNWESEAQCIIQTTEVSVIPFNKISADFALTEGEGDKSLDYWKRTHWEYFKRELGAFGLEPLETMPVVCEVFRVVFKRQKPF